MTKPTPNAQLRAWREDADLTRADMAKMINLSENGVKHGLACDEERIRRWEAGEVRWPHEPYRLAIKEVTHQDLEDLGFTPIRRARAASAPPPTVQIPSQVANLANGTRPVNLAALGEDENDVRRREFVGLTGAALFSAVLGPSESVTDAGRPIESLAAVLVDYSPPTDGSVDLASLAAAVATAKQDYQACRYSQVIAGLPALLRTLRTACTALEGDARLRAQALSAEAHHVAASVSV